MATDREVNISEMFNRILAFNGVHSAEYSGIALAVSKFGEVQRSEEHTSELPSH